MMAAVNDTKKKRMQERGKRGKTNNKDKPKACDDEDTTSCHTYPITAPARRGFPHTNRARMDGNGATRWESKKLTSAIRPASSWPHRHAA